MRFLKNLWARLFGRKNAFPNPGGGVQGSGPKNPSVKK